VVHGRDVEQWPPNRVREVLRLPDVIYERLLGEARASLGETLAPLVGQTGPSRHQATQIAAIIAWLNRKAEAHPERLDPRTMAAYRHWWAEHQTVWQRPSSPGRH